MPKLISIIQNSRSFLILGVLTYGFLLTNVKPEDVKNTIAMILKLLKNILLKT